MNTQKEMYGMTEASVLKQYQEARKLYGNYIDLYIMAVLSDAQHMIESKEYETARQFINKAKLLLFKRIS